MVYSRGSPIPDGSEMPDFDKPEPIIKPKKKPGLPCPEPVPETPLYNPAPSSGDVWRMRGSRAQGVAWNLTRHFILGGVSTGLTTLIATKSITLAGVGFVAGGVAGVVRKGIDTKRADSGKADLLTTALNLVKKPRPLTEGVDVNPILTMLLGSLDSVMVMLKNTMATSAEADKYMKAIAWNVLYFEDELHEMAAKTETPYDDAFVVELVQAATTIWNGGE